jgi:hypothetical protein
LVPVEVTLVIVGFSLILPITLPFHSPFKFAVPRALTHAVISEPLSALGIVQFVEVVFTVLGVVSLYSLFK